MSLLANLTFTSPGNPLYGAAGGGGGGGGDVTFSTITLTGQNPISATLTSSPNDGFEVRNGGGGSNVVVATTIDIGNSAQAEMGIRVLSTTTLIDRFEMSQQPTTLNALLSHANATSTLQYIAFNSNGDLTLSALPSASGGAGSAINLLGNTSTIAFQPQNAQACHFKLPVSTNTYVPQAGTTQNLGAFTSIAGHTYDIRLPVRIDAVSQPTTGDWCVIGTDTATANVGMATFDLVQVSTVANQYETHLCGSIIASGTATTLTALGKPSAGTSTAVTVTGSAAFIRDLGIPFIQ